MLTKGKIKDLREWLDLDPLMTDEEILEFCLQSTWLQFKQIREKRTVKQ